MNNELLLFIKKHTDTLTEQTKTEPQGTLEFKMKKQMQNFSFSPINLIEEVKWLLGVSSFQCTKSVFKTTKENSSFLITITGHSQTKSAEKTIDELNKILELRSLELHVKEVRKRGQNIKLGDNEYKLTNYDTQKNWILEELKNVKYNDLEDTVYRFQLTYDKIIDIVDLKYNPTRKTGYSLNPGNYEVVDLGNPLN